MVFVFVSASDPAAYGAEEIASLDAVPTLVFRLGSCLVQFGYPMQGGGCKSSTSEQAKLGAEEPRGYVQRVWQFAAPILRAV